MGVREELGRFKGLASRLIGTGQETPLTPAESTGFEDVVNPDLRRCLVGLDRNIAGRVSDFVWASDVRKYYGLFVDSSGSGVSEVREHFSQFRERGIIVPEERISEWTGKKDLAYRREQLLATGALMWADAQKSEQERDIVEIAHKALGASPIKDFIRNAASSDGEESGQSEGADEAAPLATYTYDKLNNLFGETPHDLIKVRVVERNGLPEGKNDDRRFVMYKDLFEALIEIAAYQRSVGYNPQQMEDMADELTNHGVRELLIICSMGFRAGCQNVNEILLAVRNAKGV